jgi:lipopolysaccharide export system protein LptA
VSKYVLSILLLLLAAAAFSQKKSKVTLISSDFSHGIKINGIDVIKVYNGVWRQDFSILRSDSANFHQVENFVDAFGHVIITQGDTLHIYADKLHYDGNTKIAVLTDHVVMIDKDATLTTDYFVYNTATRIGIYTNGGKIVSKTNTLTSRNGYYFAGTHDAYFRYNVVCITNDALINTDTMRYNSKTRINYFYGPTHIYGTKDKDTLDTEFGTYDTKSEQANFTKKNLYRQGTKTLTGDTLFYDRLKGFGRSVKHVIFNDNEQKITIHGNLGTYYKKNDLAIITQDPYVVLVTENDSTTNTDSLNKVSAGRKKDSLDKITALTKKGNIGKKQQVKNTLPITNLPKTQAKLVDSASRVLTMPVIDSFRRKLPGKGNIDSLTKIASAQSKKIDKATQSKLIAAGEKNIARLKGDTGKLNKLVAAPATLKDTGKVKTDSVYMSADTIETRILTYKELQDLQEQERLAHIRDTSAKARKPSIVYKKVPKELTAISPKMGKDTDYYHSDYFGPPKPKPLKPKKKTVVEGPRKNIKIDSTFLDRKLVLDDTARVRILMAFHSGKIFKSDLQAKADSIFYSTSDSTIRCYTKPMIWTQGSQLSGDTIYLRMKTRRLRTMDLFPNSFIVNIDEPDSSHFNQVGGKKMRGFFKNNKLSRVYVDGNAETIYFARDSATKEITDMQRSFSSRLWVYMKNNEVTDLGFITKPDNRYIPIHLVKEDEKVLKNFIWKPKDRPVSKESIIPSYNKKLAAAKQQLTTAPRLKKTDGLKGGKNPGLKPGSLKTVADSTLKSPPVKQDTTLKKVTVKPPAAGAKDSSAVKPPALSPAIKAKSDSDGVKK